MEKLNSNGMKWNGGKYAKVAPFFSLKKKKRSYTERKASHFMRRLLLMFFLKWLEKLTCVFVWD